MITIQLTEKEVKVIHLYKGRFKESNEYAAQKGFKRLQESVDLEEAMTNICEQAKAQGMKLGEEEK